MATRSEEKDKVPFALKFRNHLCPNNNNISDLSY